MIGGPGADLRRPRRAAGAPRRRLADGGVAALSAELRERGARRRRGAASCRPTSLPPGALALPVARGTRRAARGEAPLPEAWLIAAKDAGPLNELDRLTLHQAVTIVALELLRRRVVDDTERRLAGDVLTALVAGDLAGAELARRLEPFGLRERAGRARARALARRRAAAAEEALARAVREEAGGGLVAPAGRFLCALLPAAGDDELFALAERLHARVAREAGAAAAGRRRAHRRARRPAARLPRGALRARGARAGGQRHGNGLADARHLPRPRLLPAAALAAGRRRAAAVLRLDPGADRGLRGRLRRRADALAGGLHRVQRAVGARGEGALLPPSHAALPDPPRRGAHRAFAGLRARSHRLLARPARARAGPTPKGTR